MRLAWVGAVGLVAALVACGGGGATDADADADADAGDVAEVDAEPDDGALRFPEGFLLGSAVAGFQVDMGCPTMAPEECEDRNSDWYQWITSQEIIDDSGTFSSGDPPSSGPGHWELYESDYDLVAGLGLNSFRLSFEWSRIFPTATDGAESFEALRALADPAALTHYHQMLDALAARGLTPLVTLNHYTLPVWIHDGVASHSDIDGPHPRGWVDRERTVREIAKYAGFVAQEFGHQVDLWATENEPFAVLLPGYIFPSEDRVNPPGLSLAIDEAKTVFVALIEAHARMYDAVHAADLVDADGNGQAAEVGLVYALTPFKPANAEEPLDVRAAERAFYIWNLAFLDAVVLGQLDEDLDGEAQPREDLQGRMDWLGINYYTRSTIEGTEEPLLPTLSPLTTLNPFTIVVWEDYPRGLYEVSMTVTERYDLPIIIAENGLALPLDDEAAGSSFIVRHLTWLWRAIRDGADVRGYFHWTLVDNYEWNHGFGLRFGLYGVEPGDPTKARTPRHWAATYGDIGATRGLSKALQEAYPAPEVTSP